MNTIFKKDGEADKDCVKAIVKAVRKCITSQVKDALKELDKQDRYDNTECNRG